MGVTKRWAWLSDFHFIFHWKRNWFIKSQLSFAFLKISKGSDDFMDTIKQYSCCCCCCCIASVVSDSVWPHRRQPTRLRHPWDSPGKNSGVGCHFLLQCMKVKSQSEVAQLCLTLSAPWTAAHKAPPSMGFSRQEYWSGVPLPKQYI